MNQIVRQPTNVTDIWAYSIEPDLALSILTGGLEIFLDSGLVESPGKIIIFGYGWDDEGDQIEGSAALIEAGIEPDNAQDTFWGWAEVEEVIDYSEENKFKADESLHGCGDSKEDFLSLREWGQVYGYKVGKTGVLSVPIQAENLGPAERGFFKATQLPTMEIFRDVISGEIIDDN